MNEWKNSNYDMNKFNQLIDILINEGKREWIKMKE